MTAAWEAAISRANRCDLAAALATLPESAQAHVRAALLQADDGAPKESCDTMDMESTVAGGSVSWLLEETALAGLYAETFAEYELVSVQQLVSLGHEGLADLLRELGVTRDHRDKVARLAFSPRPCGASGGCYSRAFLRACRPLHVQHMGCENMGPLLYSLCRFVKPSHVLEVGAGYTSVWILQALADNDAELRRCAQSVAADGYLVAQAEWMVDGFAASCAGGGDDAAVAAAPRRPPTLHAIDDLGAAEGGNRGSAHLVCDAADALGLREHLQLHEGDAYAMAEDLVTGGGGIGGEAAGAGEDLMIDMMWLDFGLGSGPRIDAFLDAWWPRLRPGGFLMMHSTLTNAVTRAWLEEQRAQLRPMGADCPSGDVSAGGPAQAGSAGRCSGFGRLGEFETLSLLEPHKRYQNSVSIFQKRDGGWAEPLHTQYP